MKRKYNIALIPASKSGQFIQCSQFFSKIQDKYFLGKKSFPHVTICKFYADKKQVEKIWDNVLAIIPKREMKLTFKEISCVSFDGITSSVSLLPSHREELTEMHNIVAETIGRLLTKKYDPHLTLIDTKNVNYKKEVAEFKKSYQPISDKFVLSIGASDPIGQLTKIIHSYI